MRWALLVVLLAALFSGVVGCGHNVGDPCRTNIDCSPQGDRFCDVSSPGGYCTIDGCDINTSASSSAISTCPDTSVCIRFFTPVMDRACTKLPVSMVDPVCRSDERCVCDAGEADGCAGHCAPEASERRWCQAACARNSDCREGYECRATGTLGAEPLPTLTNPLGTPVKFCAPAARPT